jgi:hypothetical protein
VHNLVQLGMRNVELAANDRRRRLDGGVLERIAKGVSTDHSRRAHNYKACLIPRRNVHPRPRGAAKAIIEAIWLAGVMTVRAPPASPGTAGVPQTATGRPSSQTGPRSGERKHLLSWSRFRRAGFPRYGWKAGISGGAPSLRSELCCLGPSSLMRPHAPHSPAHLDFTDTAYTRCLRCASHYGA